jgi:hypothetical protein
MKKLLVVLGVLVLMSSAAFAQGTYFVDYYSNNPGPAGAADQWIRIINVGVNGTPLTTPVGDICANVYAFDNQQEMVTCCSCRITPNEFAQAYVLANLVNIGITVTPVQPVFGVIKVATTPATGSCDPTAALTGADASLAQVFGTHKQVTGGATFVTESEKRSSPLSAAEAGFLPLSCSFARYLGSGRGVCSCSTTAPG